MSTPHELSNKRALLIIDMQYDFMPPQGSLAVPDAHQALLAINQIRQQCTFDCIVLTQDWHPANHCSFYDNQKQTYPQAQLFQELNLPDIGPQMMWPVHCVQQSHGAQFHHELIQSKTDIIIQKGTNSDIDSYSGFFDNGHKQQTSMDSVLKQHGITQVYVCGLASDYCVGFTALDAVFCGYQTFMVEDASRGVAPSSTAQMKEQLLTKGVTIVQTADVLATCQ